MTLHCANTLAILEVVYNAKKLSSFREVLD
jgi:hypothetical protein